MFFFINSKLALYNINYLFTFAFIQNKILAKTNKEILEGCVSNLIKLF